MTAKKLSKHWVRRLTVAHLWPVSHTAAYYRRAARSAPDFLLRAILRLVADRTTK